MTAEQEHLTGKVDPRIRRTRIHVIDTARAMLNEHQEALTFTAVAERAYVARQTLYKHWGTVENLVAETVDLSFAAELPEGGSVGERTNSFLKALSGRLIAGNAGAIAVIIAAASHNEDAHAAFARLLSDLFNEFTSYVGNATYDQFNEIVGPVLLLGVSNNHASNSLIQSLGERAGQLLG